MAGSAETNGAKEAKGGRAVIIIIIIVLIIVQIQIQIQIQRRMCCHYHLPREICLLDQQENSQINSREAFTYDLNPSDFSQTFNTASLSATDLANPAWL